ncbi:hypothetical protein N8932_00610 [Alphaproteobacteria bacterium]|nr:hypothetical protein [Alphaproteobacteria bacterium]
MKDLIVKNNSKSCLQINIRNIVFFISIASEEQKKWLEKQFLIKDFDKNYAFEVFHFYRKSCLVPYLNFISLVDQKLFKLFRFFPPILFRWEASTARESDILKNTTLQTLVELQCIKLFVDDLLKHGSAAPVIEIAGPLTGKQKQFLSWFDITYADCTQKHNVQRKQLRFFVIYKKLEFLVIKCCSIFKFLICLLATITKNSFAPPNFRNVNSVYFVYADSADPLGSKDANSFYSLYWRNFNYPFDPKLAQSEDKVVLCIPKSLAGAIQLLDVAENYKDVDTPSVNLIQFLTMNSLMRVGFYFPIFVLYNCFICFGLFLVRLVHARRGSERVIFSTFYHDPVRFIIKSSLYQSIFKCLFSSMLNKVGSGVNFYIPYESQIWEKIFRNAISRSSKKSTVVLCQHAVQRRVDLRYKTDRVNRKHRSDLFYRDIVEEYIFTNKDDYCLFEDVNVTKKLVEPWRYKNVYPISYSKNGKILVMGSDALDLDTTLIHQLKKNTDKTVVYKIHPAHFGSKKVANINSLGVIILSDFTRAPYNEFSQIVCLDQTSAFLDMHFSSSIPITVFSCGKTSSTLGFRLDHLCDVEHEELVAL